MKKYFLKLNISNFVKFLIFNCQIWVFIPLCNNPILLRIQHCDCDVFRIYCFFDYREAKTAKTYFAFTYREAKHDIYVICHYFKWFFIFKFKEMNYSCLMGFNMYTIQCGVISYNYCVGEKMEETLNLKIFKSRTPYQFRPMMKWEFLRVIFLGPQLSFL